MRREFISGTCGIIALVFGLYCIAIDARWALALYVFAGSLAIEHAVRIWLKSSPKPNSSRFFKL
jgi:hypothetical protein